MVRFLAWRESEGWKVEKRMSGKTSGLRRSRGSAEVK